MHLNTHLKNILAVLLSGTLNITTAHLGLVLKKFK